MIDRCLFVTEYEFTVRKEVIQIPEKPVALCATGFFLGIFSVAPDRGAGQVGLV